MNKKSKKKMWMMLAISFLLASALLISFSAYSLTADYIEQLKYSHMTPDGVPIIGETTSDAPAGVNMPIAVAFDSVGIHGGKDVDIADMEAVVIPVTQGLPHATQLEIFNVDLQYQTIIGYPSYLPGQVCTEYNTGLYGYAMMIYKHGNPGSNLVVGVMGGSNWNADPLNTANSWAWITVPPSSLTADIPYWVGIYFNGQIAISPASNRLCIYAGSLGQTSSANCYYLLLTANDHYTGPLGIQDLGAWNFGSPGAWTRTTFEGNGGMDANFVTWAGGTTMNLIANQYNHIYVTQEQFALAGTDTPEGLIYDGTTPAGTVLWMWQNQSGTWNSWFRDREPAFNTLQHISQFTEVLVMPEQNCVLDFTMGGGGGAPSIAISMAAWQISIIFGSSFLVAGIVAWSKYRIIL